MLSQKCLSFRLFFLRFKITIDNMAIHYLKIPKQQNLKTSTFFDRSELSLILSIYGKKVSQGIWKDYAIDHCANKAFFSFYRSSFEKAFLQIEKNTKATKSKLKYRLIDSVGRVLKQDDDLTNVINFLSSSQLKIV